MSSCPQIGEHMTHGVVTCDAELTIADAALRMFDFDIRHLVIEREGSFVGIVSDRDVRLASAMLNPSRTTVGEIMSTPVTTCGPDDELPEVCERMIDRRHGCVVVVDQDHPIGIFTTTDALIAVVELIGGKVLQHGPSLRSRRGSRRVLRLGDIIPEITTPDPNDSLIGHKF